MSYRVGLCSILLVLTATDRAAAATITVPVVSGTVTLQGCRPMSYCSADVNLTTRAGQVTGAVSTYTDLNSIPNSLAYGVDFPLSQMIAVDPSIDFWATSFYLSLTVPELVQVRASEGAPGGDATDGRLSASTITLTPNGPRVFIQPFTGTLHVIDTLYPANGILNEYLFPGSGSVRFDFQSLDHGVRFTGATFTFAETPEPATAWLCLAAVMAGLVSIIPGRRSTYRK